MCAFIDGAHLMPGYVCCGCRTYNGFQRGNCRSCDRRHCAVEIPRGIAQCSCGFAYPEQERFRSCPVCGVSLVLEGQPA